MKKLLVSAVFVFFATCHLSGQGELNEQQKIFFRNERTFGILLNTDGFALSYREAKRINFLNKRLFEVDLGHFKHPKEVRLSNPYYQTPGTFVFGKLNSNMYLRAGIGHQHEIFKKADLGGVAIRYFVSGGPALELYKPIYYKILTPVSSNQFVLKEEKFDVMKHEPTMIYSKSSFFKGFDEMNLLPGLYAKSGFIFEYSKEDKVIHAIEIGTQVNAFIKKVPIMATESNKAIFLSLFVSYRFGVVIDPFNADSNTISSIFRRKKQ